MTEPDSQHALLQLTTQIVAAHASHNHLTPAALLDLIGSVYGALADTGHSAEADMRPQPAVPVKQSVFPDHIVCLEDGKKLKMLKRHLMSAYGMTPEQYREKWGLPASYPMVAPEYAARRAMMAKQVGLGGRAGAPSGEAAEPRIQRIPAGVRGRRVPRKASVP